MKRTVVLFLGMVALAAAGYGQQYWQGSALVADYGRFPSEGAYAASNSFSTNTVVEVTNLETGQSTTVVVVDRLDVPGVFMVLSEDAASAIDADVQETFQVRVALPPDGDVAPSVSGAEQPFHPDPDINPAARGEPRRGQAEPQAAEVTERPEEAAQAEKAEQTEKSEEPEKAEKSESGEGDGRIAAQAGEREAAPSAAAEAEQAEAAAGEREGVSGVGQGLSRSGGLLTGTTPAESIPGIVTEQAKRPESDERGGTTEAADSAAEALAAEPVLETPRTPRAETPDTTGVPTPEAEARIAAAPDAAEAETRNGVSRGASGLGSRTQHSGTIARPADAESVYSFRAEPTAASERGGIAAGSSGAIEGSGAKTGTSARAEEPEEDEGLRVSDLGPRSAPAQRSPDVAAEPSVRSPAAEGLGRRPGAEEAIAFSGELPGAESPDQTAEDEAVAEGETAAAADGEAAAGPEASDLRGEASPAAESDLSEEELAEAEGVEEAEEGLSRQAVPEDSIASLEPTEETAPEQSEPDASPESEEPEEGRERGEADVAVTEPPSRRPPSAAAEEAEAEAAAAEEEAAAEADAAAREGAAQELPIVRQLEPASYYLQVGAFRRADTARRAMQRLGDRFPYAVFPSGSGDNVLYKVLIGPLRSDERGAVMHWIRASGFSDAFFRRGDSYEAAASSSAVSPSVSSRR